MQKLLRISERVNVVLHALGYIASADTNAPVHKMAKTLSVSKHYVVKLLQPFVKAGYLGSVRGAKGGFSFLKNPHQVSVYELMELIEGPLPVDGCLFEHQRCKGNTCKFRTLSAEVRELAERSLRKMTLAQFIDHSPGR